MTDDREMVVDLDDVDFAWIRSTPVLDGVRFRVPPGQAVGLLGRNGAGKTTLMRLLLGQIRAQRGAVRVFGLDPVARGVPVRRRIGFVPEDREIPAHLTVGRALALHRALFPTWDVALEARLHERFPLPRTARCGELSRGEARQLALSCALAHRPDLLLLDEPAGGLDPAMRREFLEAALELVHDGATVLFSSHHVHDVERLADRIVLVDGGRIALDADAATLQEEHCVAVLDEPRDDVVERLRSLPSLLRARRRGSEVRLVFRGAPALAREQLRAGGFTSAGCTPVALEDLLVELIGRERW